MKNTFACTAVSSFMLVILGKILNCLMGTSALVQANLMAIMLAKAKTTTVEIWRRQFKIDSWYPRFQKFMRTQLLSSPKATGTTYLKANAYNTFLLSSVKLYPSPFPLQICQLNLSYLTILTSLGAADRGSAFMKSRGGVEPVRQNKSKRRVPTFVVW